MRLGIIRSNREILKKMTNLNSFLKDFASIDDVSVLILHTEPWTFLSTFGRSSGRCANAFYHGGTTYQVAICTNVAIDM